MVELPKLDGIPPAHKSGELARGAEPAVYLIPGLVWNTQATQTVWPASTQTGLCRSTDCQPAEPLTVVVEVTPNLELGAPEASLYTPSIIPPLPPSW